MAHVTNGPTRHGGLARSSSLPNGNFSRVSICETPPCPQFHQKLAGHNRRSRASLHTPQSLATQSSVPSLWNPRPCDPAPATMSPEVHHLNVLGEFKPFARWSGARQQAPGAAIDKYDYFLFDSSVAREAGFGASTGKASDHKIFIRGNG
ncbi:hypothetical protein NL676_036999 [Syzygium grande]|nr:hypothetical protein NL676_036999 [Syzygium grande]